MSDTITPEAAEVRALAERLAALLVETLGFDPIADEARWDAEHSDQIEDLLDGAMFELSMSADATTIEAAGPRGPLDEAALDEATLVDYLLWSTRVQMRNRRTDEELARMLASHAAHGIPSREQSFAPRHVDRALDLIDEEHERGGTVALVDARLSLIEFRSRARSIY